MLKTITFNKVIPYFIFISDIHGNIKTLDLIKKAQADFPEALLVGGGDYIDGRKDAKAVLDFLMKQKKVIILRGNHEQMMLDFTEGKDLGKYSDSSSYPSLWYANGGKKTVRSLLGKSYGESATIIKLRQTKYYEFLKQTPVMLDTPHIIFVHAGIHPTKDYDNAEKYPAYPGEIDPPDDNYDLYRLWARKEYWFYRKPNDIPYFAHNLTGKTIVTGHTPTALISGTCQDQDKFGRTYLKTLPFTKCPIRIIQYANEPARIFTDGGNHSAKPKHYGNILVLDWYGNPIKVYDYHNQQGINWQEYLQQNQKYVLPTK